MTPGRRWLLALDTATSRVVVAAGDEDGTLLVADAFPAEHRHGERLLRSILELMTAQGLDRAGLAGIVVGTGPGAFTGLRVGLATAKTMAHELGCPIVGISTGEALLAAAGDPAAVLLLPAGPHDRTEVRPGVTPRLLAGGSEPEVDAGQTLVAVDLDGRAPDAALAAGARALDGLAPALLRLGAARLAAGAADDVDRLVPEYVTLPRGAQALLDPDGAMAWSSDRR